MKVYVIRRNNGTYYKRYFETYIQFEEEIAFAEIYTIKSGAESTMDFITRNKYRFNILPEELSVVEFSLIETTGLADYTKQVRKEVCEEIRKKLKSKEKFHPEDDFEIDYDFYYKEDVEEVLNQI